MSTSIYSFGGEISGSMSIGVAVGAVEKKGALGKPVLAGKKGALE